MSADVSTSGGGASTVLVNGEVADVVSVKDRGFQFGDGLFETIAVYRGKPLLWERHLARLTNSARRLGIEPPSADVLHADAARLCSGIQRAVLKIIVTRGVGGRGYAPDDLKTRTRVSFLSPWPDYPADRARDGVSIKLCETRLGRNARLAGIKHLNRLEQVLARAEWNTEHADGLMRDEDDNIIEGTISNVFAVVDGTLRTPDLSSCGVEGIMRGEVLDATERAGIACAIGQVKLSDLERAQEIFITNSLIGVWPARMLSSNEIRKEYAIGPITRIIQQAIREAHGFEYA